MSTLIPEITFPEFARLVKLGRLKELKSCEVTFNGEYLFTAIISHGDMYSDSHSRTQSEFLAVRSNIIGGKDPQELIVPEPPQLTVNERMAKARAARKIKVGV